MQDLQPARATTPGVYAAREARAIVEPFSRSFEKWHKRSAFLGARMLARAGETDRDALREQLHELLEEVSRSHGQFQAAVEGRPGHGYIDDMRHAFGQLLSTLSGLSGPG